MIFEIRFFKKDGTCHRVKEYSNSAHALDVYDRAVKQCKELLALDYSGVDADPDSFLYHGVQMVVRNDEMTWLGVNAEWNSGEGVVI